MIAHDHRQRLGLRSSSDSLRHQPSRSILLCLLLGILTCRFSHGIEVSMSDEADAPDRLNSLLSSRAATLNSTSPNSKSNATTALPLLHPDHPVTRGPTSPVEFKSTRKPEATNKKPLPVDSAEQFDSADHAPMHPFPEIPEKPMFAGGLSLKPAPVQHVGEDDYSFQMRFEIWRNKTKEELVSRSEIVRKSLQEALSNMISFSSLMPQLAAPKNGQYNAHGVSLFLESHLAHCVHDPRVYMTQQPPLSALDKLRQDLGKVPEKFRFAHVLRVFHELGRKIASRLNMFRHQVRAALAKNADGFGSMGNHAAIADAVQRSFLCEEDLETAPSGRKKRSTFGMASISSIIRRDPLRSMAYNQSMSTVSKDISYMLMSLIGPALEKTQADLKQSMQVFAGALRNGASSMVKTMNQDDKVRPHWEVLQHLNRLIDLIVERMQKYADSPKPIKLDPPTSDEWRRKLRVTAQGLREKTVLRGAWNTYLFDDLGSAERAVHVFTSLLGSMRDNKMKTTFVSLYRSQAEMEITSTMTSFVSQLAGPYENGSSEKMLLGSNKTVVAPEINSLMNANRLPARCYLAGRRWRLWLRKSMKHYDQPDEVINIFIEMISGLKASVIKEPGYDRERICYPRIEVGLKGWGINGEPASEANAVANRFPLRNPVEGLNKDEDPFTGGTRMGYRLGFIMGYNEKRNQSLEMEHPGHRMEVRARGQPIDAAPQGVKLDEKGDEINFLAKSSYRQGQTVGARRALEVGCREGYMATLKVSLRSGMLLPLEAGSSLASLKGANYGSQAGSEAGRSFVNKYLMERDNLEDRQREKLMEVGQTHGSLAGREIGELIGSIAGHEAALEAYRRTISRGGKLTKAKFHLDEYLAGAIVGFDYGIDQGRRVAQSSNIDPSAPKFFKLSKPKFGSKIASAFGTDKKKKGSGEVADKSAGKSRSSLIELPSNLPTTSSSTKTTDDHWEQDLITPLTDLNIEDFHKARNHTRVKGSFKGTYVVAKEVKKGLQRVSLANLTYNLEVNAYGFTMNDVTYLSLSGSINNAPVLHGSLVSKNIIDLSDE